MRAAGSPEEPASDRTFPGERAALRWSADRGDVEDNWAQNTACFRRAEHIARRPGSPPPADQCVDAAEKIAHDGTTPGVWSPQRPAPQEPSRLRSERESTHLNKIESKGRQRKRREIPADGGTRAWTRLERLA